MRLVFDFDFQLTIFDFSLTYAAERSAYCELLFRYLFILSEFFFWFFRFPLLFIFAFSLWVFVSLRLPFRLQSYRSGLSLLVTRYSLLAARHSLRVERTSPLSLSLSLSLSVCFSVARSMARLLLSNQICLSSSLGSLVTNATSAIRYNCILCLSCCTIGL